MALAHVRMGCLSLQGMVPGPRPPADPCRPLQQMDLKVPAQRQSERRHYFKLLPAAIGLMFDGIYIQVLVRSPAVISDESAL